MKRVLVITDIAATHEFAAGTVIKSVLERLPGDWEIDQLVVGNPSLKYNLNELNRGNIFYTQKPNAQWQGARSKFFAGVFQQYVRLCEVPQISKWIKGKYEEKDYDWVLFAIQCQVLTEALHGIDFSESKTASFMWDDPNWFAREHLLSNSISKRFIAQWFDRQNSVDVLILPSEEAKTLFPKRNDASNQVLYPFICAAVEKAENANFESLKIGFAGSQYAREEISSFLSEVANAVPNPPSLKLEVHAFSKAEPHPMTEQVRFRGWHSPVKTRDLLSELDYAYLPYPFHQDMEMVVKTSFPSKLSLYLAAGLPIIYHGPEEAAVWSFLRDTNCGIRLDIEKFQESLNYAQKNSKNLQTNVAKTFREYFSQDSFSTRVREVFLIDQESTEPFVVEPSTLRINRVQTLAWSDVEGESFHHQINGSPRIIEYRNAVSLSKYLYILLRPEIIKYKINRRNLTQLVGTFLTTSGILVFGLISKFHLHRINSRSRPSGKS